MKTSIESNWWRVIRWFSKGEHRCWSPFQFTSQRQHRRWFKWYMTIFNRWDKDPEIFP